MLFPVALSIHLLALTVLATGGLGGLILHAATRRALAAGSPQALAYGRIGATFGALAGGAALVMLASGLLLMASRGWHDWGQPWLACKLALFALLFLNGKLVAGPTGARLGAALAALGGQELRADDPAVRVPLARLGRFHLVQAAGLAGMVLLGVFGPR